MKPIVDEILQSIVVDSKDGAASALPSALFVAFEAKLKTLLSPEDKTTFVELAYASVKLGDAGLVRAAAQLLHLARLGLGDRGIDAIVRSQQHRVSTQTPRSGLGWRRPTKPD